jgi:hypothetical protein
MVLLGILMAGFTCQSRSQESRLFPELAETIAAFDNGVVIHGEQSTHHVSSPRPVAENQLR